MGFKSQPAELGASRNARLLEELIRSTQYSNTHLSTPTFSASDANSGQEEFGHSVEPARMPPIGSEYGRNKNPYVPRRDINNSQLCAQPLFPMGSPSSKRSPQERATARARSTTGEFEAQHVTPPVALPQLRLSKGLPVLEIDPAALERWFHTGDMSCEDQDTGEGEDADRRIK